MSGGGRAVAMARGDDMLVLGSAMGKPLLMKFGLDGQGWVKPNEGPDAPALAYLLAIKRRPKEIMEAVS